MFVCTRARVDHQILAPLIYKLEQEKLDSVGVPARHIVACTPTSRAMRAYVYLHLDLFLREYFWVYLFGSVWLRYFPKMSFNVFLFACLYVLTSVNCQNMGLIYHYFLYHPPSIVDGRGRGGGRGSGAHPSFGHPKRCARNCSNGRKTLATPQWQLCAPSSKRIVGSWRQSQKTHLTGRISWQFMRVWPQMS